VESILGFGHDLDIALIEVIIIGRMLVIVVNLMIGLALLWRHRLLTLAVIAMMVAHE